MTFMTFKDNFSPSPTQLIHEPCAPIQGRSNLGEFLFFLYHCVMSTRKVSRKVREEEKLIAIKQVNWPKQPTAPGSKFFGSKIFAAQPKLWSKNNFKAEIMLFINMFER